MQGGVVVNEVCDLAIGIHKGDVDAPSEVGDAIFKVVVCELHDICIKYIYQ